MGDSLTNTVQIGVGVYATVHRDTPVYMEALEAVAHDAMDDIPDGETVIDQDKPWIVP